MSSLSANWHNPGASFSEKVHWLTFTVSSGFPGLFEAATSTAEPADPWSGFGPDWDDPVLGADLVQPTG